MNAGEGRGPEREMAEGLARAVEQAFAPGSTALSLKAARDVAQILGLDALDRALAALEPHAGRALPAELAALRDRLLRMAAHSREAGRDTPFRDEASEIEALAGEVGALEWTSVPSHDVRATLPALDALEDVRLPETLPRELESARLTLRVASALRAALDWLEPHAGSGRATAVHVEGAVLEAALPAIEPSGLDAAGHVLGSVGGALLPAAGGAWLVRVPCAVVRATYLVVVQAGRTLALPWHSVVRVHMMPAAQIEARAAELGIPLTLPLALAARSALELPVVTVALGLKRAWLVADRLIWRLAGDSGEGADSAPAGRIRTDDGTECELVDPADLLAPLPASRLPAPASPATPPAPPAPPAVAAHPGRGVPMTSPAREPAFAGEPARAAAPARRDLSALEAIPLPALAAAPRVLTAAVALPLAAIETVAAPRAEAARAPRIEAAPAPAPAPPARHAGAPAAPHARATPAPPAAPVPPAPLPAREEMVAGFAAAFGRPRAESPAPAAGHPPRALVAEDSLVARVFLTRLLEAEGYEVHGVDRAAALWEMLAQGSWALLCVDVELPDARGEALLHQAARRLAPQRNADLVALVRDEEDEAVAAGAGVKHLFRKPFDRGEVARLAASRRLAPGSPA